MPDISAWAATTALNNGRVFTAAVAYNGYLYALDGTDTQTCEYAPINSDGTVGTWATTTAAPMAPSSFFTAFAYSGYMYLFGLDAGSTSPNQSFSAPINVDGSLGTWTAQTVPTGSTSRSAAYVASGGFVYMIGGQDPTTNVAVSDVYRGTLNSDGTISGWTAVTSLPAARTSQVAFVAHGRLYAVLGEDATQTTVSNGYFAPINGDGTLGSWSVAGTIGDTGGMPCTAWFNQDFLFHYDMSGQMNFLPVNPTTGLFGHTVESAQSLSSHFTLGYFGFATSGNYLYVLGGYGPGYASSTAVFYSDVSDALTYVDGPLTFDITSTVDTDTGYTANLRFPTADGTVSILDTEDSTPVIGGDPYPGVFFSQTLDAPSYNSPAVPAYYAASNSGGVIVYADGSMLAVNNPSGIDHQATGCGLTSTTALIVSVAPGAKNGIGTSSPFIVHTMDWSTGVFTAVNAPTGFPSDSLVYDDPYCAVRLPDGKVMVILEIWSSTVSTNFGYSAQTHVFDPTANSGLGSWTRYDDWPTNSMYSFILLANGKVLGPNYDGGGYLFDPSTGHWTATGTGNTLSSWYSDLRTALIPLHDGRVLFGCSLAYLSIYDPVVDNWTDQALNETSSFNGEWLVEYAPGLVFVSESSGKNWLFDLKNQEWVQFSDTTPYDEGGWRAAGKWVGFNFGGGSLSNRVQTEFTFSAPVTKDITATVAIDATVIGNLSLPRPVNATVNAVSGAALNLQVSRGTFAPPEFRLLNPFPTPALEMLRRKAMASCSKSEFPTSQARAVARFAYDTELRSMFDDLTGRSAFSSAVPPYQAPRIQVDTAFVPLQVYHYLALGELSQLGVPAAYRDLLQSRLESSSFTHRVSAVCAIVLLAAILFQEKGQ